MLKPAVVRLEPRSFGSHSLSLFLTWIAAAIQLVRWLMKATIVCLALILCSAAHGEQSTPNQSTPNHRVALISRLTCPAVREAVKLYGEAAAEQWARGHGVSETKIDQARRCLK